MDSLRNSSEPEVNQSISIDEAMRLAMHAHQLGHHEDAYKIYTRVLDLEPNHPDALHFLGVMAHQRGCDDDALRLISHSIELQPDNAGFRSNMGNLLFERERYEDAAWQYCQALAIEPDRPDVLNNLALLCKGLKQCGDAERYLLKAIDLAPDFIDARHNLARLYAQMGRIKDATEQASEALIRAPHHSPSREILGYVYCKSGRYDAAAKLYREWLEDEPNHPTALHHLAACTGENIPSRATDAYIELTFDGFASSFDSCLAKLDYRAPALVTAAIASCLGNAEGRLVILDAGCGTGLCGPLIKPYASRLIGVDLSVGMLEKARGRNLYDALHQAELTDFMLRHPVCYDLIVSADTLVYFGDLAAVLHAAATSLRPGGYLCFTLESQAAEGAAGYRLQHHGRYAHSKDYVSSTLTRAGLSVLQLEEVVLRFEGGEPVAGLLLLARRPRGGLADSST